MAIEVKMISTVTSYYITYTLMQTVKERTNHTTVNLDSHTPYYLQMLMTSAPTQDQLTTTAPSIHVEFVTSL